MKAKRVFTVVVIGGFIGCAMAYAGGIIRYGQNPGTEKVAEIDEQDLDNSIEVVGTPTGDDPWKEIEKITKAYYSGNAITYEGNIKVIDDNGDEGKVVEEQHFVYTLKGDDYYYKLGEMEIVSSKKYLIAVDNAAKTIAVSQHSAMHFNRPFDTRMFKKIMLEQKANASVAQLEDEKILTIDSISDPNIQGYRIYYSPLTYRVSKMLIGMTRLSPLEEESDNEEMHSPGEYYYYLEVLFQSIRDQGIKMQDVDPGAKFVNITKNKIELTPAYKEYQLLSNIVQ